MVSRIVDGQLARLEGSLNCLIYSQLGAAQLLAHQLKSAGVIGAAQVGSLQVSLPLIYDYMLTSMSNLQLEALPTSSFSHTALQPLAAESEPQNAAGPLAYTFIKAQTVVDV
jgi:hypothetical protein